MVLEIVNCIGFRHRVDTIFDELSMWQRFGSTRDFAT